MKWELERKKEECVGRVVNQVPEGEEREKTSAIGRVKRVFSLESIEAKFVDKHHDTTLSTGASTLVFKVNPKIRSARRDGRLRRRKFIAREVEKD